MKYVFVSYSIEDNKLHLITLLLDYLRKEGYVVSTSDFDTTDQVVKKMISNHIQYNSDVFVGIITNSQKSIKHVMEEWNIAKQNDIPYVLLIEEGITIDNPQEINFIRFNRQTPQKAIDKIFNIATPIPTHQNIQQDNTLRNILIGGGIILGLAALISLLSED